jgi:hypothetical protein
MTSKAPLHTFYLRAGQHSSESIQLALIDLHLDEVWLRLTTPEGLIWGGSAVLQLELYHLRDGMPIMPEALGPLLSEKGNVALRLSADPTRTSVAFELHQDGRSVALWAGDIERFGDESKRPKRERSAAELAACGRAFAAYFRDETGLDFSRLCEAETVSERAAEIALEGTHTLIRNRMLKLVEGMGRWPELYRFHDRHEDEEKEAPADGEEGGDGERERDRDHVALVAFDARHAERTWRLRPANQAYQFLRRVEPLRSSVLGPLSHVLGDVLARVEAHPPEQPLAAAAAHDLTVYEVLAIASSLVYMVGDRVSYLDERFFPLLALSKEPISRAALADSLQEIRGLDVVAALTDVVPYNVPEGQMMDAFADEELAPLAPWAVEGDSYEGSLFLLQPARIRQLVDDFDIDELRARVDEFLRSWHQAAQPAATLEEWLAARRERDDAELSRFEDTFVELQHVLKLAELNGLAVALVFYSE